MARNVKNKAQNSVRIIGGKWRGRKLPIYELDGLRPTGDRMRETLFNWLTPYLANSRCLDLFAGTGALGFEALSRGANFAELIEQHPAASKQLQQNLNTLACNNANVHNAECKQWLSHYAGDAFDIIFIDPPFAANLWQSVLTTLASSQLIHNDTLIYIETPASTQITLPEGWVWHRQKTTGNTAFGLAACHG